VVLFCGDVGQEKDWIGVRMRPNLVARERTVSRTSFLVLSRGLSLSIDPSAEPVSDRPSSPSDDVGPEPLWGRPELTPGDKPGDVIGPGR